MLCLSPPLNDSINPLNLKTPSYCLLFLLQVLFIECHIFFLHFQREVNASCINQYDMFAILFQMFLQGTPCLFNDRGWSLLGMNSRGLNSSTSFARAGTFPFHQL